jgi:hypothetical protein
MAEKLIFKEQPDPFPFYPMCASVEEKKRHELMIQLNMWANNDPDIAVRMAQSMIILIADQFGIDVTMTQKPKMEQL